MTALATRATRTAFRLIILRDVLAQRVRTSTTIAGIALGIAVLLAIQLASATALRGFSSSVESLAGRAALEITQAPLGIDERRLPALLWLQDYGQVTPIIEGEAAWTAPDGSQQVLKILGIDILTDLAFRDYVFTDRALLPDDAAGPQTQPDQRRQAQPDQRPQTQADQTDSQQTERQQTTRELLSLLTDRDAVVLTKTFARAHGLSVGSDVRFAIGDREQTFHVRALLDDRGPARALGGNLIVMDIAAAQVALARLGYIDRLELRIDDGSQLDRIEAEVRTRLSASEADTPDRAATNGAATNGAATDGAPTDGSSRRAGEALSLSASPARSGPLGSPLAPFSEVSRGRGGAGGVRGLAEADWIVQRPARRGRQVEKMQAAFRSNLSALSTIALIAGMFLVYNTVSASVLHRRQEIGMLRAVGASRALVFGLFTSEALVLALPGCLLGLLLGRLLAQGAIALTASTVSRMYVPAAAAVPPALDGWHVSLAFLVGLPLALIAAAAPAREAARIPPTDAIRRAAPVPPASRRTRAIVAIASFAAAAWLCTFDAIDGLPLAGYLATFFIIVGTTALTAPLLLFAAAMARRLFGTGGRGLMRVRHPFFVEPWLATSTLVEYARRMSVSVAALAVSLAMTVAIAVMVSSFRDTVIYWVNQTFVADLYVGPAARRAGAMTASVPADIEAIVRAQPGVAAVDGFRILDIPYEDARIFVAAGNYDALLSRTRLLFKSPAQPLDAIRASIGQDAALVTEAFALRYHMRVGDRVTLPTPAGPRAFPIVAIYYDYASDRGTVMLDRPVFARHFGERPPMGLNVYLDPHADASAAQRELVRAIGRDRGITVFTNGWLRGEVLRVFDGTFAITWALEVVAIIVAVMGIIATLVSAIDERRPELAMLRLVGASRGQVERMVVFEAALLGAIGQALGLVAGFGLSLVLIYVINVQSFGWSIQFHPPFAFLIQLALVLIVATALAGLYPARRAARTYLTEHGNVE